MRLHRLLLYLYPSSFRKDYGTELSRIFSERRRRATGVFSVVHLWTRELVDVIVNACLLHCDIFRQDMRYAARTLAHSPGFALTAIIVTGLGIGANTAAFSVTDRVLVRPLPFKDADRLVQLWQRSPDYPRFELSPPNFYDWRRVGSSFEEMAAYGDFAGNLSGEGDVRRLEGSTVTPAFFQILRVRPLLGRVFNDADGREGAPRTVILSYQLWQTVFGGRADILGRAIRLDGESYTVIGVMGRDFLFPDRGEQLWTPFALEAFPKDARDNNLLQAIARLKPGVSLEKARAEMSAIAARLAREYPKENANVDAAVDPLDARLPNQTRLLLSALLAASFCVLLIACANLANLLLARTVARRRELAVRAAIGAGRERLMRQLLTESVLLSTAGGAAGLLIAAAALPLLSAIIPARMPFADATVLDARVLAFTLLSTLATGLIFGVLPAWRACRAVDQEALRERSGNGFAGRRERLRSALVIAEIAISLVLLVSSVLLIRALWRVQSIDPGFRADSVFAVQTWLPMPRYELLSTRTAFYTQILSNVRSLHGVSKAAYISSLPMMPGGGIWPVAAEGSEAEGAKRNAAETVAMRVVTPGYFAAMGIPIRAGRDLQESDTLEAPPAAVVSESFVRRYWPNQNPIGRKFHFAFANFPFAEQDRIVVGVAGDVRFRGLEVRNEPQVYLSYRQLPDRTATFYAPRELVIRTATDASLLVPAIRRIIQNGDPELPITAARPLTDIVNLQTAPRSTQIRLVIAFAALSIVLAGFGIHGLLSFAVGRRSGEFGVRIALGAQSRDILSMVLKDALALAGIGAIIGLVLSYYAGWSMQALLAGVPPLDPLTMAVAVVVAVAMTLSGSMAPALRAMRTDPSSAIRTE